MSDIPIYIKPSLRAQHQTFLTQGRVLFLSAPCGTGKTTLANALFTGPDVRRLSAASLRFALPDNAEGWHTLVLDDLQYIQDESAWQQLCTLIRSNPTHRFVLLSRGVPHSTLMAFQYTGLMRVFHTEDLLFNLDDLAQLMSACSLTLSEAALGQILAETGGQALAVSIVARLLCDGAPFDARLRALASATVFSYFETAIYHRLDLPMRRFLLSLAPFPSFTPELSRIVSGNPRAEDALDWLRQNTTMFTESSGDTLSFWPQFRAFLSWKLLEECTPEKQQMLLRRGGLYYELSEDYPKALDCYSRSNDHSKVSELLIRGAELHPGMGYYSAMEKYYRALPEQEILASPALMQAMSMLCALATDYDGSDRYYQLLAQYADQRTPDDAAARQARSRMAWLDISLPQRGVEQLAASIPRIAELVRQKQLSLPPFSVTSTLPSVMNGGKDFSDWSRADDLLDRTLRGPLELALGKDGVGVTDCAMAESKYEKGEDISARLLELVSRTREIQQNGTPDTEFAVTALLARSQMATGRLGEAIRLMQALRTRFTDLGLHRFLPNLDAMLCRAALRSGDLASAERWYREKAPRDPMSLNILCRYQYFTQSMVELANNQPDAALLTLAPLEPYCASCNRHIDSIHLHCLRAIALERKKDAAWRAELLAAMQTAEHYSFIRPISNYGAQLLPLLEQLGQARKTSWYRHLLNDTRRMASYYPAFLQPPFYGEALTDAERQVLRLLCAGKSNAEIGTILSIKLTTVKTHVSHILDKLGVSRRSEVRPAAQKLWLIPLD